MPSSIVASLKRLAANLLSAAKTLRVRLMVWNAGLVCLTAMACFLGVREGVRRTLLSRMDAVLTADLEEISLDATALRTTTERIRGAADQRRTPQAAPFLDELNRKAGGHQHSGWFVELVDDAGKRLWASDQAPKLPGTRGIRYDRGAVTDKGYRIVEQRVSPARGGPLGIRVGAPIDFIDRDVANIDTQAGRGVVLLLVGAPLVGYWLAGRTIRPLAEIIRTTARLRPNRLEERLTIRNTGDELDRLSRTVNQFLDRIAAYLTQSNDLLANSAHELRTPLAAIRSSVEVALAGDRSPQEYQELLAEVIDECASLERLVNQLLLLAETDSERLRSRSERLVLSTLVARCVEMFSAAAEAAQIQLVGSIEPGVEVVGYGQHLRQVVNNLLDNALKFTAAGGTVSVDVFHEADAAVLRVRDTGYGIAAGDLPHIFERFFRGDKSRERSGTATGTGLGLSICQAIARAHGGRISVESREGAGTTMTVRLPLSFESPVLEAVSSERQLQTAAVVARP